MMGRGALGVISPDMIAAQARNVAAMQSEDSLAHGTLLLAAHLIDTLWADTLKEPRRHAELTPELIDGWWQAIGGEGSGVRAFAAEVQYLLRCRGQRGASHTKVYDYIMGRAAPSLDFLHAASCVLGVDLMPEWVACARCADLGVLAA